MARKSDGPAVIEVLRMNINQFEQAVARGDAVTAKRCIDAAEPMFRGMRDVASGGGCDVGPSVWRADEPPAPEPDPLPAPTVQEAVARMAKGAAAPEASPTALELEAALRRVFAEQRRAIRPPPPNGWMLRVERREWGWALLARLCWAGVCCAAALGWRGGKWFFHGLRRTP